MLKTLAGNIKQRRKEIGLSQEALAEIAEMSRDYLACIETSRDNPSLSILTRIATALGTDVPALLAEPKAHPQRLEEQIAALLVGP
ncbi:MAG: helix-turn-helix domain-containing protein [Armatimonadota bacterium]